MSDPLAISPDIPVAILAGGLATRMRPLTETIPKSLLPVAGHPFLTHQLKQLKRQGIQRVVLCTGHLGHMIEDAYGDGSAFGLKLVYSQDGPTLLGTGGALKQALPFLDHQFFVLYGDSYLPVDFPEVARAFQNSGKPGLMTVYHNQGRYDASNVWFEDGIIKVYDKKKPRPELQHIDYGLSLFKASVFQSYPADQPFDLAQVMYDLVSRSDLAGFEVRHRFYEIGSPAGLAELEEWLLKNPAS
jgi:NDP-sugar pyrophosphorylase family protein